MRSTIAAVFALSVFLLSGCTQGSSVRFTRTMCMPVVGEEQTEAVRFISDFRANTGVPDQQLVFQVQVVDAAGRALPSRTGRYKDLTGALTALKTVMVVESPWSFENINVAIPAEELNAAREDGAAYAEFRVASPEGEVLASQRVPLPSEFAGVRKPPPPVAAAEPPPTQEPELASTTPPEEEAPPRAAPPPTRSAPRVDSAAPPTRRSAARPRPDGVVRESPAPDESAPPPPTRTAARRDVPRENEASPPSAVAANSKARSARQAPAPQPPPKRADPPAAERSSNPRATEDHRGDRRRRDPAPDSELEPAPDSDQSARTHRTAESPRAKTAEIAPAAEQPPESTSPPAPGVGEITKYVVKPTDSLRSISLEHYGDAQYWPMILRANPDLNPLRLRAGDTLVLPALDEIRRSGNATAPRAPAATARPSAAGPAGATPAGTTAKVYVTRAGDTLPDIAKRLYGDSRRWRDIYDANRSQLDTPTALREGMRLILPDTPRDDHR